MHCQLQDVWILKLSKSSLPPYPLKNVKNPQQSSKYRKKLKCQKYNWHTFSFYSFYLQELWNTSYIYIQQYLYLLTDTGHRNIYIKLINLQHNFKSVTNKTVKQKLPHSVTWLISFPCNVVDFFFKGINNNNQWGA